MRIGVRPGTISREILLFQCVWILKAVLQRTERRVLSRCPAAARDPVIQGAGFEATRTRRPVRRGSSLACSRKVSPDSAGTLVTSIPPIRELPDDQLLLRLLDRSQRRVQQREQRIRRIKRRSVGGARRMVALLRQSVRGRPSPTPNGAPRSSYTNSDGEPA